MDIRKLTSRTGYAPHNQALIYDEATGVDVAVTYSDQDGQTAAELARRWNAFPALVEALRKLHEHAQDTEMDSSEILQGFSAEADAAMENARSLLNTLTQ